MQKKSCPAWVHCQKQTLMINWWFLVHPQPRLFCALCLIFHNVNVNVVYALKQKFSVFCIIPSCNVNAFDIYFVYLTFTYLLTYLLTYWCFFVPDTVATSSFSSSSSSSSSSCVFFLSKRLTSQGVPNCPILCSSFQFTVISQFCPILEIISPSSSWSSSCFDTTDFTFHN